MKITASQYAKALHELTEGKSEQEVSEIVSRFALRLKKDGQIKNAGKIMEKFSEIYNSANGIVEAVAISARSLSDDQLKEVESFVKGGYSAREAVVKNVIDEGITGGIIIRIADEVLDASVTAKLGKLEKILSK